jgi:indolepyruvate ferredoxin oxidoreductase
MTYKDEYEVARLHLDTTFRQRAPALFTDGARMSYMLHPPFLRALGLKKKLRFGAWSLPALRALGTMKALRGTPADLFGYAHIRRVERELPGWYRACVHSALDARSPATEDVVQRLVALPEDIRGYEEIKLANVARVRRQAADLLAELDRGYPSTTLGMT